MRSPRVRRDPLPWIAPRDVKPGALYADAIMRAITNAKALVLVLSESSNASSHVGKEVERASSKKRPIIALRTDAAPLTPALEYFLSESQWIDASATKRDSAYAQGKRCDSRLLRALGRAAPQPHRAAAGTPKSRQNRRLLKMGPRGRGASGNSGDFNQISEKRQRRIADEPPPSTAARAMSDKSIAVLPFADMSEEARP